MLVPLWVLPLLFAPARPQTIPFQGCATSGQIDAYEAPNGPPKSVRLSRADARMLAWYESADGIRVLGPRGQYCEGLSGSSGAALYLRPSPTGRALDGPVIVFNLVHGESSGSFEIAEFIGRAFPAYRDFGRRIWESTLDTPYPGGRFPRDVLKYRSKMIVEFKTPAQTEGLGNLDSLLSKGDLPIAGAAILTIDPHDSSSVPDLVVVSIRLPRELAKLTPAIVRYVESEAAVITSSRRPSQPRRARQ